MTESYIHGGAHIERPLFFPIRFLVKMRKTIFSLLVIFAAFNLFNCGNGKKQIKGVVKDISDSSLTLISDGDASVFVLVNVDFPNGNVMSGDSAIITYKGQLTSGEAQADIVYLIPPKGNVINLQQLQKEQEDSAIKTRPADPEKRKKFEQFLKMSK